VTILADVEVVLYVKEFAWNLVFLKLGCGFIFYVYVTVHHNKFLCNKTNQTHQFPEFTGAAVPS
jgi:hypothetical protein